MTKVDDAFRLVRKSEIVFANMDKDLVMMSIERGAYYGIGGVGSRIWQLLEQPTDIAQIVELITAEFDVDEHRCRKDVHKFVQNLIELDLIKEV